MVIPVTRRYCPLFAAVRTGVVKLAAPEPLEITPVTGVWGTLLMLKATVEVTPGSNPNRLIVAEAPSQITDAWEAPVKVGVGLTVNVTF